MMIFTKVWIVSYWGEVDKVFSSKEDAEEYIRLNDHPNKRMSISEHEVQEHFSVLCQKRMS